MSSVCTLLVRRFQQALAFMKITSGCKIYATRLFEYSDGPAPRGILPPLPRRGAEGMQRGHCRGGSEEQRGAEEVLTWVENLHGGVGVRMLFMDHLSADLLCEDLPGDPNGIRAVNMTLATTETEECENRRR